MEKLTKEEKENVKLGCLVILIIVLLIAIICSLTTVKSGEVGLKVRYGKIVDESIKEGINVKLPFIEKIVKVNIRVQKAELDIESSTKDLQVINTTVAVNYRVDGDKASYLYKTVGDKYESTVLLPAIKEAIKSAIAQYNAEEITTNRNQVSASCLKAVQDKVLKYGIIIEDFNLTDFSFSKEYTKAIEAKQVAEQELLKAQLEAEKKITEAKATAEANSLLQQTLTDKVLMEKFIERWDGVLPSTYAGEDITAIFGLK